MPILISNNNDSYELGLIRISFPFLIFIYVYFLHNFLKEWLALEEFVDDLGLLNWYGVCVDFFEGNNHAVFHKSTELGFWNPLVI